MLKLIPAESPDGSGKRKKNRNHASRKASLLPKIQQKHTVELDHQKKILKVVGYKLVSLSQKDNPSENEVAQTIHGLQKSIICLQKQRQKTIRNKRRKK